MTAGWIAFLILLAYIAGIATSIGFGQWFINKKKEKES